MKTLGQVAYEAYCEFAQGASLISGAVLPEWDKQNDRIKGAWQMAAEAAVKSFVDAPEPQMHRDETLFPRSDA